MFRKTLLVLAATVVLVSPAFAAKRLTVEQLQEVLTASRNKPDVELAWQIAGLEMAERVSDARLAALAKDLPGDQSRRALRALADQSQFLDPPPDAILSNPTPTPDQQRQIMAQVVTYVTNTIPQLPNFFATRETIHFADAPSIYDVRGNLANHYEPLHAVGESSQGVTYRGGLEVVDEQASQQSNPPQGLNSWGEFGPVLSTVLLDAAKSKLTWNRWEQGDKAPVAVFSYSVPKSNSHYQVDYCCLQDSEHTHKRNFEKSVGYHGEIVADPASGAILRLALVAELKSGDEVSEADILVDYGPVEIGGKTYMCPVRSLALSKAQMSLSTNSFVQMREGTLPATAAAAALQSGAVKEGPQQTLLNDVTFTDYHIFRSESRMVADNELPSPAAPDAIGAPAAPASTGAAASSADSSASPAASAASPANSTANAAAPPPPEPAEFTITPATGLPNVPAQPQPTSPSSNLTLHTSVRLVDVDVVVYDRKGHPITDLKQSDFQIFDEGRQQTLRSFAQAGSETAPTAGASVPAAAAQPASADVQPVFSNRAPSPDTPAGAETSVTILLIDSTSLAQSDFSWARDQMLHFLKVAPADERIGLYILKSAGLQVLSEPTTDRNKVSTALNQYRPSITDLAQAQDAEQRNRQQIDEVHKVSDLSRVNGNTDFEDPEGETEAVDPQLRTNGGNPARDALIGLIGVARHLATVPGHKSLVWVSSDNVLADWTNTTGGDPGVTNPVASFAVRAQVAMNDAHVSVYPLDASQLEGSGIDASLQHRNVELTQAAKDTASLGVGPAGRTGNETTGSGGGNISIGRNSTPGRNMAAMQQDLHPIQASIRQLAFGTGGRALRRAGDISSELNAIVADGRAAYLLSFTPDVQPDNKYHQLVIKVAGRRDVSMRYRTGYLYIEEPATLRDRFQQVLWQPGDATDLTLVATPLAGTDGPELRLNIAGTGLDLAQQGERYVGKVDIFFMQRDDANRHARIAGQTLSLDLKPGTYQDVLRDGVPFKQNLVLRPNLGSLRVIALDENSGRIGSVTLPASALQ